MKHNSVYLRACLNGLLGIFLLLPCLILPVTISADANALNGAALLSLEQIEPLISDSPEALAGLTTVSRDETLATKLEEQRTGVKYFTGLTLGNSNEPVFDTSEAKRDYNKLSLTGGLNFPLFGAAQKDKTGKTEVETAVMESKYRYDLLLLNNLEALRKAYTTLWIEEQKAELAERFLSTETETANILAERQAKERLLPADRLEFLAVYHDVKRDLAASKLRQKQALNLISQVTGRKWEANVRLKTPSLPDIAGKIIDFNIHPEVVFQNKLIAQYEKLSEEKKRPDREANLALGLTSTRDFPGATGTGAYVAFSMTGPVKAVSSEDQDKLAANFNLDRVRQEETLVRLKLAGQADEALATLGYAAADVKARVAHLIVMAEAIREKRLRQMVLPGDVFEQLEHSKAQYYRICLEILDHEEQFLDAAIMIVSYVYPNGLNSEAQERFLPINGNDVTILNRLLAPNWLDTDNRQDIGESFDFSHLPGMEVPVVTVKKTEKNSPNSPESNAVIPLRKLEAAVYVWNARPFLQSDTRAAEIKAIAEAGFSRVLISFTTKQLNDILLPQGRTELEALLNSAQCKGLRMDLLLGDPTWAEPARRGELISLLHKFRNFKFSGIHLDIEPDSLPDAAARRPELLDGLADTVKAVKQATKLPVSISIHPRYLEGDLGALARQKLLRQGLENIVVMVYSDNPSKTAQRMAAIMTANPKATFAVAQSVEENIPVTESYAGKTRQQFSEAMHLLEDSLANYGLKGIWIQAWEDYRKGATQ